MFKISPVARSSFVMVAVKKTEGVQSALGNISIILSWLFLKAKNIKISGLTTEVRKFAPQTHC